jgi:hypothetical protein
MPRPARFLPLLAAAAAGCTFHSTATKWNGRVTADGRTVFVATTWAYSLNGVIVVPMAGDARLEALVDQATANIAEKGGDRVRVLETEYFTYWYALPPVSFFVTPVYGSVTLEYEPSAEELASVRAGVDPDSVLPEIRP